MFMDSRTQTMAGYVVMQWPLLSAVRQFDWIVICHCAVARRAVAP